MELAVLTITAIGIFLFSISYFKFAYEGFRHHIVTGFLALIPVINIVALPTLWDRTRGMLMIGLIGLIAAIIAWFAGADKAFEAVRSDRNTPVPSTQTVQGGSGISTAVSSNANNNEPKETFLTLLPGKALYRLDFESASPNQIRSFAGRTVRITSTDHVTTDGRIQNFTPSSVFIEQPGGNIAYEMMLSNIKSVHVMVKRAAR